MAESQKPKTRVTSVMEDPVAQQVARVYADAFLGAAESVGVASALEEFASFLEDVVAVHPQFEAILLSGILSRDEKMGVIDRVVSKTGSEFFANYLRVLAKHERLELLPHILAESRLKHEILTGKRRVQVTSATELSSGTLGKIRDQLAASLSFEPILEPTVDPSILGGVVIRIGDTVYDSSLSTRMKQLRVRLRQRSLHEIQSGRNRFSHSEGS